MAPSGIASKAAQPRKDGKSLVNTLTTAKGETYQIILPDQTKVWLNAASSIKFPVTFAGLDQRKIQLSGEAYFEVSKDKRHPFIVTTGKQEVEVLGTHFNINSYADEPATKTTLLEGAVKVRSRTAVSDNVILKPGQQSNLTTPGNITVDEADPDVTAWKDGKFRFNNTSLESILRQLSRWYNVDINYVNGVPDEKFTGGIDRNLTASEALDIFRYMKVRFKIEGRTILVTK